MMKPRLRGDRWLAYECAIVSGWVGPLSLCFSGLPGCYICCSCKQLGSYLPFQGTSFSWHSKIGMRSSSTECWHQTWRNSCPSCTRPLWGWPVSTTAWPSAGPGEPSGGLGSGRACLIVVNQFLLLALLIGTLEAKSWSGQMPNNAFDFKHLLGKWPSKQRRELRKYLARG